MASIHSAHDGVSPASPQLAGKVGVRELQLAVCEAGGVREALLEKVAERDGSQTLGRFDKPPYARPTHTVGIKHDNPPAAGT